MLPVAFDITSHFFTVQTPASGCFRGLGGAAWFGVWLQGLAQHRGHLFKGEAAVFVLGTVLGGLNAEHARAFQLRQSCLQSLFLKWSKN